MLRTLSIFLSILMISPYACKRRSLEEVEASTKLPGSSNVSVETDLDTLRGERNALIAKLEAEQVQGAKIIAELTLKRDELNSQRSSADLEVTRLQKELDSNSTATVEEKAAIQTKLTAAIKQRDAYDLQLKDNAQEIKDLLKKMDSLSEEIKTANAKITVLNSRIEVLEKQLSVEQSKVETIAVSTVPQSPEKGAANSAAKTTPTAPPAAGTTPPPASTAGVLSQLSWQFFRQNADNTRSCFESGSTLPGATILGLPCVTPAPVRQLFKTESYGSQFLLIDQRTQLCVRVDSAAAQPATARILSGACLRGGDLNELWVFSSVDTELGSFHIKNVKTGNCMHFADDRKLIQVSCAQAVKLFSAP